MKRFILLLTFTLPTGLSFVSAQQKPVYENDAFRWFPDRIEQGKNLARAISRTEIESNYVSPANDFMSPTVIFKFSINGKDNEMRPGSDHHFSCTGGNGVYTTPLIRFGSLFLDPKPVPENAVMQADTKLTIRLDLHPVLDAFQKTGYYTTWDGNRIYPADLKAVYIAGAVAPLTWDFDNLFQRESLHLKDPDGDGIYETVIVLNSTQAQKDLASSWKQQRNLTAFPQYQSGFPLTDALYNLSLEEMENAIEPDSTFRTGKEWAGVWTRDISYSITLAMAYLQPQVAKNCLLRKVKNGKIIQDTGTGGAYPASTDRMIWATAAWEVYKVTGDKDWLQQAYRIIKQSADDDTVNAYDPLTGMVKGESSFLDWREQTYPKWMQPADIYESENLGTNAVHKQANTVLGWMATELGNTSEASIYAARADQIKQSINQHLWLSDKGYYGQYLYGRNYKHASPRSEALGEALSILFNIADQRSESLMQHVPNMAMGIPTIYPQIPGISPYHNQSVWPFVQAYWAWAGAKMKNEAVVIQSMAAIYRAAALFLTNKENFVVSNGDYKGTVINSSNMLWSLSGQLALIHRILFGIRFETDGLYIEPFVPKAIAGERKLTHFTYRHCQINITLQGYGDGIRSAFIDGKKAARVFIPANATGTINISIELNNQLRDAAPVLDPESISPATPIVTLSNGQLNWEPVPNASRYILIRNGKRIGYSKQVFYTIPATEPGEYQVIAVNATGVESFASQPIWFSDAHAIQVEMETDSVDVPVHRASGFSGKGYRFTSTSMLPSLSNTISVEADGWYAIDVRYANGHGPVNTDNKCAIRSFFADGIFSGVMVFPQRGVDEWSNWGFSNAIRLYLKKGSHEIRLSYQSSNENMNGTTNEALLDYWRITALPATPLK